ncbi:MAG: type IV pilus secretin PilQ [Elusimicrobia bacterium]|nr:type IV pilus secretin PilQ [Elusimicrobiota bacterium]
MQIKSKLLNLAAKFSIFCVACFMLVITASFASEVKDITVKSDVNSDTISIFVSSKTKYNVIRLTEPNRLIIELNNCEYTTDKKELKLDSQFIKEIRGGQYKETPVKKVRIVAELSKSISYSTKSTNDEITISIVKAKQAVKPRLKVKKTASAVTANKPPAANAPEKTEEPKVGAEGTVNTSTETVATPPVAAETQEAETKKSPQSSATIKKSQVVKEKQPVQNKKVFNTAQRMKTSEFSRDLVTLDFNDADIKDVLQILAVKTGMNIICSDDVSGSLTLHLEKVPFNEAMNIILQMKGLVLQQVGTNVLRIMTPATLTKERADSVQVTQVFRLSYAKASDIGAKIIAIINAEGQKLSIQNDERTNSIIVTSTPEGLLATSALIGKLDVRPEQVVIEAKIVEITVGDTKDLGIEWNLAAGNVGGGDKAGIGTSVGNAVDYGATPDGMREPTGPLGGGVGVAAPAQSTVGAFTFGYLKSDLLLTARLSAAESKGKAKILSQPRIATLNNLEAKIVVGGQIPYTQTSIAAGGVSTQSTAFMTVGIQLTVTPTINADGRITMKVKPTVSNVTRISAIGPETTTKEAETTVLVKDGETVVIGGLITDSERKDASQIPILGDLPVLGYFFKNYHNDNQKTELMIFVTPYIMKQ